jgi:hypothetical protein
VSTVLIVSPHFPPATLAGVHRARHMAKHLPEFGWTPIIIRAGEEHYTETLDPALARLVPDSVIQIRTGAFPSQLARRFGVGDIGLRAFYPIKKALFQAVNVYKPEVIFITGSPYYPLLLTSWIKRTFDIPVVLDFQDPWVSAEGALRPKLSKGGLSHLLATFLEPHALRDSRFVTSVSDRQNQEMANRYPWLDRSAMAAIPIGGDPEDFEALRASPPQNPIVQLEPGRIHLSYVGTFLPKAGPLVETLFSALAQLRVASPLLAERLLLNFVGTSNQPDGGGSHLVTPIAKAKGVVDLVCEVPQRVPFLEALSILANSNGLMLIGSDEPHYTASKIYPALMSTTPYISMFHRASSAYEILSLAGGGFNHCFSSLDELPSLVTALKENLARFAEGELNLQSAKPEAYSDYIAHSVAGRFASIFNQVTR